MPYIGRSTAGHTGKVLGPGIMNLMPPRSLRAGGMAIVYGERKPVSVCGDVQTVVIVWVIL